MNKIAVFAWRMTWYTISARAHVAVTSATIRRIKLMSTYRLYCIALVVTMVTLGCSKAEMPEEPECDSNAACSAPTGVCNLSAGTCVECTTSESAACVDKKPVCGPDYTCQPCSLHSQCSTNVCLPDGSCTTETTNTIAYVKEGGTGTVCSKSVPCGLLSAALSTRLPYVKISGNIVENVTVNNGQIVTLLADVGAKLTPKTNDTLITLVGGSKLTIYDLELSGAAGGKDSHAISMPAGNNSTLSLYRAKILKNSGAGIRADGGTLNIFQSVIAENKEGGIYMLGSTSFDIRNNFIAKNGDSISSFAGGVRAVSGGTTNKIEFNTIVKNKTSIGMRASAGLDCSENIPAPYNLVFDNVLSGSDVSLNNQIVGCDGSKSLRGEPPAGAGFRDANAGDYHLTGNTAADIRDKVDCNGNTFDFDGEFRPQADLCDFGADEYKP